MHRITRVRLFSVLIFCLILSHPSLHAGSTPTRVPPGVHVSDSQLESTLRAKLAKSKIGKDGFRFKVAHGVVTWEGSTQVPQHKGSATRMARTSGASQVINNIQVTGGAKPGIPAKKAYIQ